MFRVTISCPGAERPLVSIVVTTRRGLLLLHFQLPFQSLVRADPIDRKSMLLYKRNLSLLAGRYGDLERRILGHFAEDSCHSTVTLPGGFDILVMYLVRDKLLQKTGRTSGIIMNNMPSQEEYELTENGRDLVTRWRETRELA